MHRLKSSLFLALVGSMLACGGGDKPPASPADDEKKTDETGNGETAPGTDDDPSVGGKKASCEGFDIGDLEDLLSKSECEVADARPDALPAADMKGKLEVTVTASPTKVAPGAKADLLVTFANKSKEPLPLSFRIDPLPRFETETYDAKDKRADMPPGKPPPPPKGHTPPPPAEQKVGRVTVAPNGSARVRVPWEAVKMKWAPDKLRGAAVEKGYPRSPAGPLPKGKYTVKVVTPLVGVSEGGERELTTPKVEIEVAP